MNKDNMVYVYIYGMCMCMCVYVCVCVCNGILFGHKKNEMMQFPAPWMDLEVIRQTEGQARKDK